MLSNRMEKTTLETLMIICRETAGDISFETVVNLPTYKSLVRNIQRQRVTYSVPHSIKDIAVPLELSKTLRGDYFLLFDSMTKIICYNLPMTRT